MKQLIILLYVCNTLFVYGQDTDYVILRQTEGTKTDTVSGEIIFPKNGAITRVKIQVGDKKVKYHPDDVIAFKHEERYFASVPYKSKTHVFAERVETGEIELYHYDTNPGGYNGGLLGATATSLTSYYFIRSKKTENYLRVSHSRKKVKEEISFLFKDNAEIYDQILSEEFRIWKLPDLVKQYNSAIQNQKL